MHITLNSADNVPNTILSYVYLSTTSDASKHDDDDAVVGERRNICIFSPI
jgi:hypothetical protein